MIIYGTYKNINDTDIKVVIYDRKHTSNVDAYEISDDDLDATHHFCFRNKAIKIKHNWSDMFSPIITGEATISLVTNIWVGDMLYASDLGDIIVYIMKGNELEFLGFVEPRTYEQPINKQKNVIEVHCIDYLMSAENLKLSTIGNSSYGELKMAAKYTSILDTLEKIGLFGQTFTFPDPNGGSAVTFTNNLLIDSNIQALLSKRIHESLWLGDEMDDEKSLAEILEEICKYTNTRIVSPNGETTLMLCNNVGDYAANSYNSVYNCNEQTVVTTSDWHPAIPKEEIANEKVSMDEVIPQISVTCKLDTLDDVIESPLQKDALKSPYTNLQLYMTEYMAADEVSQDHNRFMNLIRHGDSQWRTVNSLMEDAYKNTALRNWYIRYVNNPLWTFNNNFSTMVSNNTVVDAKNVYKKQYMPALDMNNTYETYVNNFDGLGIISPGSTTMYLNPYIISFGKGNKRTYPDVTPDTYPSMKNYLIIPCPETWLSRYNSSNITEQQAYDWINGQLAKYDPTAGGTPMITYNGNKTLNLSPSDSETTNYIVFTGRMKLLPSIHYTDERKDFYDKDGTYNYRGLSFEASREWIMRWRDARIANNTYDNIDWDNYKAQSADARDKKRFYWQRYYTRTYPSSGTIYSMHEASDTGYTDATYPALNDPIDPDAPRTRNGMNWMPDVESYAKQYLYGTTKTSKYNWNSFSMPFCSVLQCRLQIGDKYVNETTTDTSTKQTFEWSTDPNSSFTLGIRLTPNEDCIIGEGAKDLMNNIDVSMNIEGSGTAIPITQADNIHGELKFEILGPFNATIDNTHHYYKHATWFRSSKESWDTNEICLLNHVRAIQIEEFECVVKSDHAKNSSMNTDNDLCYMSTDTGIKTAEKKDIDFELTTSLTEKEAYNLGIATGISYNNPLNADGTPYTATSPNKPEEKYITSLFNLYDEPKKIIEYKAKYTQDLMEMYRAVYLCDLMSHMNVANFNVFVTSTEIDLYYNRIKVKIREI